MTIDDISYLDPDSINGLNLYVYCGNNPANQVDYDGTFAVLTFLICLGIGMVVGGILGGITAAQQDTNIGLGILTGALLGGIIGAGVGVALGAAVASGGGFVAFVNHSFISGGTKAVFGKFLADLTANVLFDKPMGSIIDYMSAFAFGGVLGSLHPSEAWKKVADILVRPAYNILLSDVLFKGQNFSSQKYLTNVVLRSITAWFPDEFKPIARGILNGVNYQSNNGGLLYINKNRFDLMLE